MYSVGDVLLKILKLIFGKQAIWKVAFHDSARSKFVIECLKKKSLSTDMLHFTNDTFVRPLTNTAVDFNNNPGSFG